MSAIKLRKVGGSVAVAIPPHILESLSLGVGSEVDIVIDKGRVVLSPKVTTDPIGMAARLALCDLKAGYTKAEQEEIAAWQDARPAGREVI